MLTVEADWSVEAAGDDPVLVVPWASEDGSLCFIDVRHEPERVQEISECQEVPELCSALLSLNQPESGVWTAKCDAWELTAEEAAAEAESLDLPSVEEGPAGFASYIDILLADGNAFQQFALHEAWAKALVYSTTQVPINHARAEYVVRVANVHSVDGFAMTAYIYGLGVDLKTAKTAWAVALHALWRQVRGTVTSDGTPRISA